MSASYTIAQIMDLVRYQVFNYNGKSHNLHTSDGIKAVPNPVLKEKVYNAANDVALDLKIDTNVATDNCIVNSDEKLLPSDFLTMKDLEIFSSETPAATETQGETLRSVNTVDDLYTKDGKSTAKGLPWKYMVWEKQGELYLKFNKICDVAYKLKIFYFVSQGKASETSNVGVIYPFDQLVVIAACRNVASTIGDTATYNLKNDEYERKVAPARSTMAANRTPGAIRFREMPGL